MRHTQRNTQTTSGTSSAPDKKENFMKMRTLITLALFSTSVFASGKLTLTGADFSSTLLGQDLQSQARETIIDADEMDDSEFNCSSVYARIKYNDGKMPLYLVNVAVHGEDHCVAIDKSLNVLDWEENRGGCEVYVLDHAKELGL
jgi:hypothetical protein